MMYWELFFTFFKIGAFTFGGGYAMLPLITEQVAAHSWMDVQSLVNFVAVSESTPGPFAVNIATYIGSQLAGIPGALCATLGVVLPSFIIILIIAHCFSAFKNSRVIKGIMRGLRPAVIGMIGTAVISVGKTVFFPQGITLSIFTQPAFYVSLAVFALMLVLALKKKHPILIICLSAGIGIAAGYLLGL